MADAKSDGLSVLARSRMVGALRSQISAICFNLLQVRGVGVDSRGNSKSLAAAITFAFLRCDKEELEWREGPPPESDSDAATLRLAARSIEPKRTPS